MTHVFLKRFDVVARNDAVDGERVPKIVDAMVLQSGVLKNFLELFPYGWL